MKKRSFALIVFCIFIFQTNTLFSAGIYQNQNQSAEFIRTINRSASTDVDAVYFNPAATAFLPEGYYYYLSNQMITDTRKVKNSSPIINKFVGYPADQDYTGRASTIAYPDVHAVVKKKDWAFFGSLYIIGAGASATFRNGLPQFDTLALSYMAAKLGGFDNIGDYKAKIKMDGLVYFIGAAMGTAYAFNNWLSAALGVRYIQDKESTKVSLEWKSAKTIAGEDLLQTQPSAYSDMYIDSEGSGHAYSFIFGMDIKPVKRMNIGLKYEYHTVLKVKNKTKQLDAPADLMAIDAVRINLKRFENGAIARKTMPMVATIGVSYMLLPYLKVETDFTYFFNKLADWGRDEYGRKNSDKFINGWDVGMALEYSISPKFKASTGFTYSISGRTERSTNEGEIGLDCVTAGIGASYSYSEHVDITISGMHVFFRDQAINTDLSQVSDEAYIPYLKGRILLSESTWVAAFGVTYKIPKDDVVDDKQKLQPKLLLEKQEELKKST